MKIDRNLHLVVPITQEDGSEIFVHSTPISSETYKTYWKVLARTFTVIHSGGFLAAVGPKVALETLEEVARQQDRWEGATGVASGFLSEVRRRTNLLSPVDGQWQSMPFDDPRTRLLIDPEEFTEIEGKLVFFTLSYHLHDKAIRRQMLQGALAPWRSQIVSLDCTAFMNSLAMLTRSESSATNQRA